jgi:hypothetical protein
MGVHEGRGNLNRALKDLTHRWQECKGSWDDAASETFERRFLVPLEQDLRKAVSAMDTMAVLLGQIRRDCE